MKLESILTALDRKALGDLEAIAVKVRDLIAHHNTVAALRHCAACGKTIADQQRRSRLYCGDTCRQRAHRSRKITTAPEVRIITARQAGPFIAKWHYSKIIPRGKNVHFGWYVSGRLYAVASYGIGVNAGQDVSLAKITGESVTQSNLFELKRLCRVEPPRAGMQLTRFIAACHRVLKREHGIRFIVSFSDPEHNRFDSQRKGVPYVSGGIYRAANFQHLGKTAAEWHVTDDEGAKRHRRVAYRHKERHNAKKFAAWLKQKRWKTKPPYVEWPAGAMTMEAARKVLGLKQQKTESKDRWFLRL